MIDRGRYSLKDLLLAVTLSVVALGFARASLAVSLDWPFAILVSFSIFCLAYAWQSIVKLPFLLVFLVALGVAIGLFVARLYMDEILPLGELRMKNPPAMTTPT